MELLIILLLLLILGLAAIRWGHDSRDTITSQEWERRQKIPSLTHHD